jgi:CRISPR-associated helicase Cas3
MEGDIPTSCSVPTGLGKAAVIAIWLIALAHRAPCISRRLVFVVNRRTVVDQTTDQAEWQTQAQELVLKNACTFRNLTRRRTYAAEP